IRSLEVPVHIRSLRNRRDHLKLECLIRDLLIVLRNPEIAQVRSKAESSQQLLLQQNVIVRVQRRIQKTIWTIRRTAAVIKYRRKRRSGWKILQIADISVCCILLQRRNSIDGDVRQWLCVVLVIQLSRDRRVESLNIGSSA